MYGKMEEEERSGETNESKRRERDKASRIHTSTVPLTRERWLGTGLVKMREEGARQGTV